MAFIRSGSTIISFAEYQDVVDLDQRLFEENEGLTDQDVEDILIRSTERILVLLKNTKWYTTLALSQGASILTIPNLNAGKIKSRLNDFTDLACYYGLYEYILPKVADFGTENNSERVKIDFYQNKFTTLFDEVVSAGDWYDYSGDGTVSDIEKKPGLVNYQRVR
jgi:hypothetical protein